MTAPDDRELFDWLDDCFSDRPRDPKTACAVALALCSTLEADLDPEQIQAVRSARRLLDSEDQSERLKLLERHWARDRELSETPASVAFARSRLVLSALTTNAPLDVMAAEYLADWALRAGATVAEVRSAFADHCR